MKYERKLIIILLHAKLSQVGDPTMDMYIGLHVWTKCTECLSSLTVGFADAGTPSCRGLSNYPESYLPSLVHFVP